jgi:hypothetical protein
VAIRHLATSKRAHSLRHDKAADAACAGDGEKGGEQRGYTRRSFALRLSFQLDCAFESIGETGSYFQTSIESRPTLAARHDHAAAHAQTDRQELFARLLSQIDDSQASRSTWRKSPA